MLTSTRELIEAEMGILGAQNVAVCDTVPSSRGGGPPMSLVRGAARVIPWDEAFRDPDAVHVIHTFTPYSLHDMKRKVFVAHGVPEYCWWDEISRKSPNWWQITTLLRLCDATVCWFHRDREFWEELSGGSIHPIRRGVDLEYWRASSYEDPLVHPYLLYADALRLVKLPFTLLFAVKKVQRVLPYTYIKLVLSDPETYIPWSNLVTGLGMEHYVPMGFGMLSDPRPMYTNADMVVSPVMWGFLSRVPLEAMACGTPIVCLSGVEDDDPIHGVRVDDTPESMASGIIHLWSRIHDDPQGEREKARKLAERHYDIRNTARELIKVCEGVM